MDDLDASRAALDDVIELEPDNIVAHRELGIIHMRQGNYQDAVRHFERLVDTAVDESELQSAYLRLGEIHLQHLGNSSRATQAFQLAQGVKPSNEGLLGLADAYLAAGEVDLAHLTYRRLERRGDDENLRAVRVFSVRWLL